MIFKLYRCFAIRAVVGKRIKKWKMMAINNSASRVAFAAPNTLTDEDQLMAVIILENMDDFLLLRLSSDDIESAE